jgi:hypothetical protein
MPPHRRQAPFPARALGSSSFLTTLAFLVAVFPHLGLADHIIETLFNGPDCTTAITKSISFVNGCTPTSTGSQKFSCARRSNGADGVVISFSTPDCSGAIVSMDDFVAESTCGSQYASNSYRRSCGVGTYSLQDDDWGVITTIYAPNAMCGDLGTPIGYGVTHTGECLVLSSAGFSYKATCDEAVGNATLQAFLNTG